MKEIKDDINSQRNIPCSWMGRKNIVKMSIASKAIYRFKNPYQTINGIFHRTTTNNFTVCMEIQKTQNSQSNLEKEERNWRNQPLKIIQQSYSHQDSMILAKDRNREQQNKIESPEINPSTYGQRRKKYTMQNKQSIQQVVLGKLVNQKLEHFLIPYTVINSKWIKDLNVRPETMKLLEEKIGRTCFDINYSKTHLPE